MAAWQRREANSETGMPLVTAKARNLRTTWLFGLYRLNKFEWLPQCKGIGSFCQGGENDYFRWDTLFDVGEALHIHWNLLIILNV